MSGNLDRREFLKNSLVGSAAALSVLSFEERALLGAATDSGKKASPSGVEGLPAGRIGKVKISRLICGGNLIGGWAHSRDLTYVSPLVKAYHTDEKVLQTLELAEELGVNAVLTNPISDKIVNRYWNERGGKIQWISDCAWGKDVKEGIKRSVDSGAHAVYIQGGLADMAARDGKVAALGEALEYIKGLKVPGGIGAHDLDTIKACVKAGFQPDFWVKTIHPDNYWSATPKENRKPYDVVAPNSDDHGQWHDNMYCRNPQETIEFMATLKQPWIGFKVLAAGAVPVQEGFKFALEAGADFLCVGMFDFQMREDVMIARNILAGQISRSRPWC